MVHSVYIRKKHSFKRF